MPNFLSTLTNQYSSEILIAVHMSKWWSKFTQGFSPTNKKQSWPLV